MTLQRATFMTLLLAFSWLLTLTEAQAATATGNASPATATAAPKPAAAVLVSAGAAPAAAGNATAGNATAGRAAWEARCSGCHALDSNVVGPLHRGVYGRVAGKVPDFKYSARLQGETLVWNDRTLEAWLTDPEAFLPGQKMYYQVANAGERADIIAYLKSVSGR